MLIRLGFDPIVESLILQGLSWQFSGFLCYLKCSCRSMGWDLGVVVGGSRLAMFATV